MFTLKCTKIKVALPFALILILTSLIGCKDSKHEVFDNVDANSEQVSNERPPEVPVSYFKPPLLKQLPLVIDETGEMIWGAATADVDGNLFFAVSSYQQDNNSASLLKYIPDSALTIPRSDVITQLASEGNLDDDIIQDRIQGNMAMAEDGYLYFVSMDYKTETREKQSLYGGRLWRKLPQSTNWDLVLNSDASLATVHTHGQFVYTLGHWGHVLYQYNTQTQRSTNIPVGSVPGHYSRDFLVDASGSIFVPRIEKLQDGEINAVLVEIDESLGVADFHPLNHYWNGDGFGNHGIVSQTLMENGELYFVTSGGYLYKITQNEVGRNVVHELGLFDTQQTNMYISALYSPDNNSLLVGLGRSKEHDEYRWFIRELNTQTTVSYPIVEMPKQSLLLYGAGKNEQGLPLIVGGDKRGTDTYRAVAYEIEYQ
ncbi:hypothetical protein PN836_007755 [Ningiella sp. W23]|uniref:hypothetical protein n=1 Tax=Ningiella sp. W23 TaxID=3023715 RepID=UPI003757A849